MKQLKLQIFTTFLIIIEANRLAFSRSTHKLKNQEVWDEFTNSCTILCSTAALWRQQVKPDTYLCFLHTCVEGIDLTGAQTVHKVVLFPTNHQDRHLSDAGGLWRKTFRFTSEFRDIGFIALSLSYLPQPQKAKNNYLMLVFILSVTLAKWLVRNYETLNIFWCTSTTDSLFKSAQFKLAATTN